MITDIEIEKARSVIANAITASNYRLSKVDPLFPRENICVHPEKVVLEPRLDTELVEFRYAGWHAYVSHNPDLISRLRHYVAENERCHVEFSGAHEGLVYLISNESAVRKK